MAVGLVVTGLTAMVWQKEEGLCVRSCGTPQHLGVHFQDSPMTRPGSQSLTEPLYLSGGLYVKKSTDYCKKL